MSQRKTVYLVDDDPAMRDSLNLLFESAGLRAVCYASAVEFLDAYRADWPGCLILDVRMPEMSGLELQEVLAARRIRIPIVFVTGHGDVPMSVKAMKAGAVDFLEKPFDDEMLLDCVRQALARDTQSRELQTHNAGVVRRFSRLTEREQEVMGLVVEGFSNKEIAIRLRVSHRTVEVHRSRLMAKMEAPTLPDLVSMAALCGIASNYDDNDEGVSA